jgi:hypothetical protein
MTSEDWQKLEAISSAATAASVIVISGLAAFWAWYRDTERLKIRRFGNNMPVQVCDPLEVRQVDGMQGFANIGITIVNNSLIPSGIVGAGFDFGGQTYWFREPEIRDERTSLQFRQRQATADPSGRAPVPIGRKRLDWPLQVPAKGRVTVWAGQFDLRILTEGGVRISDIFYDHTAAVARTESGKIFLTRSTWFGKMRGDLKESLREMRTPKPVRFTFDVWNDDRGSW